MMEGVTPGMVVGVNTEVIAGEKLIITAGAIDAHGESSNDRDGAADSFACSPLHLPSTLDRGKLGSSLIALSADLCSSRRPSLLALYVLSTAPLDLR